MSWECCAKIPRKYWESIKRVLRKSQENHKKVTRQSGDSQETFRRQSWVSNETVMTQSWDSHETVMRQSWDSQETVRRMSWCSHERVMRNLLLYFSYRLFRQVSSCRQLQTSADNSVLICSVSLLFNNVLNGWPHYYGLPFRQRTWSKLSESDLLILLITFCGTLWTLEVNCKKLSLGPSCYWYVFFSLLNWFWVMVK